MTGTVYLVGAGPGDPGLLTCAGRDALAAADVVIYDRLAHPDLLEHAPPEAERLFVGKESARHHVRQEDTNALMAERALAGHTVVRLKGGDPFVFGRGGEEAEYLRDRGVPFVVIPGVTSAIAALAYAGIPVTHRDAASSFAVVTGHERDDRRESGTRAPGEGEQRRRWDRIAHAADTLVFLMGVEALPNIAARLIENGRDPATPAALVQWGTWNRQRTVTGTLADIAGIARDAGITAPAVTVVGDVVRYRDGLRWFDNRPLFGRRVLVTRAREQASVLSRELRARGAQAVEFPVFAVAPPADRYAALDAALADLAEYRWVAFASRNGVDSVFARLQAMGRDTRAFGACRVAAVGAGTADALAEHGIRADFVPTESVSDALASQLPDDDLSDARLLVPRAADTRGVLEAVWRGAGAQVDAVEAYRMVPAVDGVDGLRAQLASGEIDAITFASSNTVRGFVDAVGAQSIGPAVVLAAIGPVTAQTCSELLRAPDAVAEEASVVALVDALEALWKP